LPDFYINFTLTDVTLFSSFCFNCVVIKSYLHHLIAAYSSHCHYLSEML